ncbi:MAG TPA: amidophosphoribosyltransferase [Dysgonamonadaceae bacterium]|uniref:amidophosphoribosyltransferase n=1 Tax=Seramator thermalis TaxID=2496270 RepID=UPI00101D5DB0|nr:amidophosphoribosyltransferase [Seramator thermalis]HOM63098.1 amidophosphoribosyltransferase [Dysgonamonadaceae bacterium]HOV36571.1 amidophosphoribosyltransferase [Dysgonamonadaceae bacterium]HPD43978.1 amidophosphoribosyltransferase [Dysgonamonadaceae bacterium]HRS40896.1 amidophosphoribosyltransferase [Dysgonamonadaceae bacterium]
MTDKIKHECGIALIRLLKPLEYYYEKYGTWQYGLEKLYLLMEKQHNRGQEGAGLASVKLDAAPGTEYIFRERGLGSNAIPEIFENAQKKFREVGAEKLNDADFVKKNVPYAGELFLGHLRYSTTGRTGLTYVHPLLRRNNWASRSLLLAGNFNMTNVDEMFIQLISEGQHPRDTADTFVILESLGHYLDREVQYQYDHIEKEGLTGQQISNLIEQRLDISFLLKRACKIWDGGYVISGLIGCGDAFAMRDPWGIRPAFYYHDDEVVVVASERPVIQTAFNLKKEDVHELQPGQALIVKRNGRFILDQIAEKKEKITPCSFERIYFSRGSDYDIYRERKKLGELLIPKILKTIDYDFDHTVFSFIPNTAEVAYFGMLEALEKYCNEQKAKEISEKNGSLTQADIQQILSRRVRSEKVAIKDIKLRTFIAGGNTRNDLAAHVYDITYGSLRRNEDTLVIIDDSIVRGTTLKQSIIKILDRLDPVKIVIVSSSPQIRYPDYYGIDMSRLSEFIAFKAAMQLLKERGMQDLIDDVYRKSLAQKDKKKEEIVNYVKELYAPFTDEEISDKIAQMLTPEDTKAEVEIVFQSIEDLHRACPEHAGDWYFSGDYPTPGGNRMVNYAFINYMQGQENRPYQFKLNF